MEILTEMGDTNPTPIPPSTNERQWQGAPNEAASSKMKRKVFRPSLMVWSHFTKFVPKKGHLKLKIFLLTLKEMELLL